MFSFDVAVGEARGKRPTQEDFVFANFPETGSAGLAVLSDGMGGHRNSIVAAKFLVTGVAGELSADLDDFEAMEDDLPGRLEGLTHFANLQLGSYIRQRAIKHTIGATLLSVAISNAKLFWASVGDSPLYVIRDGQMNRLNADHSMSPQIDFMVEAGMISKDNAVNHPDRSILTSAIYGKPIKKIDCPGHPFELQEDDVILLASDGLASLEADRLIEVVSTSRKAGSNEIVRQILAAIGAADLDDQDNTALVVVQVLSGDRARTDPEHSAKSAPATPWSLELKTGGAAVQDAAPEGCESLSPCAADIGGFGDGKAPPVPNR